MQKTLLAAAVLVVLASSKYARGLDVDRTLRQLHHTAWTIEDGAPPDIWALAQSPDGYLWLGTGAGLYRFDGVRFEAFRPAKGDEMPSDNINALLADPAGDIWVGFATGAIFRLRNGRIKTFNVGLAGAAVNQIAEDRDRVVWAALRGDQHGGLARFAGDAWQVIGEDWGLPAGSVSSVLSARDGALWVAVEKALFVLRRGAKRFEAAGALLDENSRGVEAPNGQIWWSKGVQPAARAIVQPSPIGTSGVPPGLPPVPVPEPQANRMIIDRDGALWGSFQAGGIFRIGRAGEMAGAPEEKFALKDGLSSDLATPLLEDREGNIWVGTNLGLDRFRATNIVSAPGLPVTSRHGFFATRGEDGAVYVASGDTLFRAHPDRTAETLTHFAALPSFLSTDHGSGVWAAFSDGLSRLEGDHLVPVDLPPGASGKVSAWMQDRSGKICISVLRKGVFCLFDKGWQRSSLSLDAAHSVPVQLIYDHDDHAWLSYDDRLVLFDGAKFRIFSDRDGLSVGGVDVVARTDKNVLVGGEFGLARYDGIFFTTLRVEQSPALSRISGIVQTSRGDIWLNSIKGVVRVSGNDIDDAFKHPDRPLHYELFDLGDGLPGVAQQDSHSQTAIEATDGRLWFVTSHGVAWLDPEHLVHNPLPPPVSIRAVVVNGREYPYPAALQLPAGVANLEIDYTALSLTIPDRVRFRYRLDGIDNTWIDPGTRRQAFYTKLGPGEYLFHVVAANNDGVWNSTGSTLTIVIPPTFVESTWFKALLAIGLVSLLGMLYYLRLNQMAERMRDRLEERLRERERIARELHDTLLQGFQGLVMQFQAVSDQIKSTHSARQVMENALDLADEILAEGRTRVFDLRLETTTADIEQAFATSARKMLLGSETVFSVVVEGKTRLLHPAVKEEASRIGHEALSNAARHAKAESIEVSVIYHPREFRIRFRDDGVGIDARILSDGGRRHHFGMIGMRERADKIHAAFAITSRPGAGTEVTLSVPASIAYAPRAHRHGRILRHKPALDI